MYLKLVEKSPQRDKPYVQTNRYQRASVFVVSVPQRFRRCWEGTQPTSWECWKNCGRPWGNLLKSKWKQCLADIAWLKLRSDGILIKTGPLLTICRTNVLCKHYRHESQWTIFDWTLSSTQFFNVHWRFLANAHLRSLQLLTLLTVSGAYAVSFF